MRIQGLVSIVILTVLAGCASSGDLSRQMADWQSQHVSTAIEVWGEPDEEVPMDGQTVLTWYDRSAAPFGVSDNVIASVIVCERMLAVAYDGTITGWRWRGDRCDSVAPGFRKRGLSAAR